MRKSILSAVAGVTFLLGIAACSEENKYDSSVVTDIQLYLDDEAYSLNTGSSNKPLFTLPMAGMWLTILRYIVFSFLTVHTVLLLLPKRILFLIRAI